MLYRISRWMSSYREAATYALMRVPARSRVIREAVAQLCTLQATSSRQRLLARCESRMDCSTFAGTDLGRFVRALRTDGVATGLRLPKDAIEGIRAFAARVPCYADRREWAGFQPIAHSEAEHSMGKPILLAQYFNTERECSTISALADDPALLWIATSFLGVPPVFAGANLWWTFPVHASDEDRDRHAHLFHRDLDDFRFLKFFFYLTDVTAGEGAHVCVRGSQLRPPVVRWSDRWKVRRYSDDEIASLYDSSDILEMCGPAGTAFAENTLCVHKGRTPASQPRLLLQLQFGLFDYGVMHDRRDPAQLSMLDTRIRR